jgi:GNAT superfamily N-acetyltransferase
MPRITDPSEIRTLLETDRGWSAYALGDLSPDLMRHCDWFRAPSSPNALALIFRAFQPPVLFTLGAAEGLRWLLGEMEAEAEFYLSVRPEALELVKQRWLVVHEKAMWRMLLDPLRFRPTAGQAERLGPADVLALQRLYADGEATGEAPGFFTPEMLREGIYFGTREGSELTAAAGTHLVVPAEGVAAIGNVYTRRDRRGRGLGATVTSAVVTELLRFKLSTVALNVAQENEGASHLYEGLGFVRYVPFYEGLARKR